ncbi:MAG: MFS transporter [Mycobacteriales bacterium]|nr:MFS transporter [Mycobacteriales bacterium]
MSVTSEVRRADGTTHKGLALVVIAISQLMVVLDATIVNVALDDIYRALDFTSQADLSWVVTGYTLTFGGFLLLGGKLADRLGRRRVFIAGAVLFAVASALGGAAANPGMLIAARLLQGLGGALMSPAALSLLTVTFEEGPERNKALGVFSAITAGGAALGLILGGLLTDYLNWRWVLLVNIPIAVLATVGALRFVPESKDETAQGFDVPGAVLATTGLIALVYGLVKVNDPTTTGTTSALTFAAAVVLLVAFVVWQLRTPTPLVPFRLFKNRNILAADVGALLVGTGIFALFFFVVLWMQQINGYSAIRSGLAFLPMTFLIGGSAAFAAKTLARTGARPLLMAGMSLATLGMLLLGLRLEPDSSYVTVILPSLVLVAMGMGMTFVALTAAAIAGVPHEDAGIASALLNAGQQVGGALGLALLAAVSTGRSGAVLDGFEAKQEQVRTALQSGPPTPDTLAVLGRVQDALVQGWGVGFVVAAGFLLAAGLVFSRIKVSKEDAAAALKESMAGAA